MGCGSRAGKKEQHSNGKPHIDQHLCRGCRSCLKECANNALVFDTVHKKMTVDKENCVGCGRCLGSCNFDAISFEDECCHRAVKLSYGGIRQGSGGRPSLLPYFLVVDVSPYCDCHGENDVPILPDLGMFASFDPVALDQACVDACLKATPLPGSRLTDNMNKPDFVDHHDHFINTTPNPNGVPVLEHAERIGLGTRIMS